MGSPWLLQLCRYIAVFEALHPDNRRLNLPTASCHVFRSALSFMEAKDMRYHVESMCAAPIELTSHHLHFQSDQPLRLSCPLWDKYAQLPNTAHSLMLPMVPAQLEAYFCDNVCDQEHISILSLDALGIRDSRTLLHSCRHYNHD